MRDSPVVLITILWVVVLGVLIARFDAGDEPDDLTVAGPDVDCATETSEPTMPAEIHFGAELAGPGRLQPSHLRLPSDTGLAYLACLEEPLELDEVELELVRLQSDGGSEVIWQRESAPVAAGSTEISGEVGAGEVAAWGAGTFLLQIHGDAAHPLARGSIQIATAEPERIEVFPAYRPALLRAGEHVGYRFDESGQVVEEHSARIDEPTPTRVIRRATYDGTTYLLVVEGTWERYWLPEGDAVVLAEG